MISRIFSKLQLLVHMTKTQITICTFNIENLFTRYKVFGYLPNDQFKRKVLAEEELEKEGGFLPGQMYKNSFKIFDKGSWRKLTAKAIKGYGESKGENSSLPDILCLQEVDSMDALRLFNEGYLDNYYDYAILLDSHDPRRIDVGVLIGTNQIQSLLICMNLTREMDLKNIYLVGTVLR